MGALDVFRGALGLGDPSVEMVRSTGLEPAAAALAWQCSTIELRTRDLLLNGAHDRNRTCVTSTATPHSAIELRALKYFQDVLTDLLGPSAGEASGLVTKWSTRPDLNRQPLPWQVSTLPVELHVRFK